MTAGEPMPTVLDPMSVLGVMKEFSGSCRPQLSHCLMTVQCLATSGQIETAFELLTHFEAFGLLSHPEKDYYTIFHAMLEACRVVGDSSSASRLDAAAAWLRLRGLGPTATVLPQDLHSS
eukprot:gnl/TRDRNA2_/TRDRNA2_163039_c0_seq2.p2 gnl/TRDRNA2_/TRDRNA2_163039_c0~~gnl/TRDRNA2_/TRDRNA2_163039_c0_seq2.p2  ORF type:complete len:120 (-),score=15.03 gnl/TRDRNA2_/TRDRNA2_163039_c0_seq2:44-403(-)